MQTARCAAAALLVALLSGAANAQRQAPSVDLIEIDVVVKDRDGRPVTGLQLADFELTENGRPVQIQTFSPIVLSGSREPDDARSVVLLLDDLAINWAGGAPIRMFALDVVGRASPGDHVAVVRLSRRSDEPFGDARIALDRIAAFEPGVVPFNGEKTIEDTLRTIAGIARDLAAAGRHRKLIVCIGSTAICNIKEPSRAAPLRRDWVEALRSAAEANVSVYAITADRGLVPGNGIVFATGGEMYAARTRANLERDIERLWGHAAQHYLLGYWSTDPSRKDLNTVRVKVARRGLTALARRSR